jgi:hypothetical protein
MNLSRLHIYAPTSSVTATLFIHGSLSSVIHLDTRVAYEFLGSDDYRYSSKILSLCALTTNMRHKCTVRIASIEQY